MTVSPDQKQPSLQEILTGGGDERGCWRGEGKVWTELRFFSTLTSKTTNKLSLKFTRIDFFSAKNFIAIFISTEVTRSIKGKAQR